MNMFYEQQNKENNGLCVEIIEDYKDLQNGRNVSSIFDSPRSSISSLQPESQQPEQDILVIVDEDDSSDIEIEEISNPTATHNIQNNLVLKNLITKLNVDTELINVKPNAPIRICTSALSYSNLPQTQIIMINHSLKSSPECVHKRELYINKPNPLISLPVGTRIYHRSSSLLGFISENPCPMKNFNRYLILYDNLTAYYHLQIDFHLCLCQDFQKHLLNIDYSELRSYYKHVFQNSHKQFKQSNWTIGTIIRIRKFGTQYHYARIIDKDCSIIKICLFQRKSQPEMWIYSNSPMIDSHQDSSLTRNLSISSSSLSSSPRTIEEMIISDTDLSRLRKRKTNVNDVNEGQKKLRDRSNTKQWSLSHQNSTSSTSSNDEIIATSRANMLTAYYTDILLPKFRLRNSFPYRTHKCSRECVLYDEENFFPNKTNPMNPFLIPFECQWSIIDGKPRGYRTPCHRTLYSLDDIEKYLYRTESKLPIKFFIDDLLTRFSPAIDKFDNQYILMNDLSNGIENLPISVYNDINNDKPDNFTYITHIRPYDQTIFSSLNDQSLTTCCNCIDNCNDRMKCACFRKTLDQALLNHDPLVIEKQKTRQTLSQIIKTTGYQKQRLLNPVSSGIYECNSKCSCNRQHCSNRLVQDGLFVQLQLFKDKNKGWGLRTLHDLPRGTFICQYVGELITSDQGHERAQIMDDKYQTSLDLVKQIHYEDGIIDDINEPYVIDGSLFSNLGKYFNHSCDPNMYIQNVFIESHDLHFPNLALFTRTRVKAGEELTWHYNCELLPDRQVKCYCGSKNCRGRLF